MNNTWNPRHPVWCVSLENGLNEGFLELKQAVRLPPCHICAKSVNANANALFRKSLVVSSVKEMKSALLHWHANPVLVEVLLSVSFISVEWSLSPPGSGLAAALRLRSNRKCWTCFNLFPQHGTSSLFLALEDLCFGIYLLKISDETQMRWRLCWPGKRRIKVSFQMHGIPDRLTNPAGIVMNRKWPRGDSY